MTTSNRPALVACKYRTGIILGRGTFSVVKEAIHIETGEHFAFKVINKKLMAGRQKMVENEIKILQRVSAEHPNIVTLHDYFESSRNVYICFDLCTGGQLLEQIWKKGKYHEPDAAALVRKVCDAVSYIHRRGIAHCDLKPDNLLFHSQDDDAEIMIADFGLSRIMEEQHLHVLTEICGTPGYMAPEIYRKLGHGLPVDIWALGVITFYLLAGYNPFDCENPKESIEAVVSGDYKFEPKESWVGVSDVAKDFIKQCLTKNHEHRPTAAQLLEHDWLSGSGHFVPDQSGKPFDLLPLVKQASQERQKWKKGPFTTHPLHHFTRDEWDGTLGNDSQTVSKKVQELVDEANLEDFSTTQLVLHFMGEHAQTVAAGTDSAAFRAAARDENELDVATGSRDGDLESNTAVRRMYLHEAQSGPEQWSGDFSVPRLESDRDSDKILPVKGRSAG